MKKLAIILFSFLILSAVTPTAADPKPPSQRSHQLPVTVLNDISIPYDVMMYAQDKYQGYAITQASKSRRGSQTVYQLRVDRDDVAYNGDSFYLLYSLKWDLLGKAAAPAIAPADKKTEEPKKESKPDDEPEERRERNRNRGRGNGRWREEERSESQPDEPAPAPDDDDDESDEESSTED